MFLLQKANNIGENCISFVLLLYISKRRWY